MSAVMGVVVLLVLRSANRIMHISTPHVTASG